MTRILCKLSLAIAIPLLAGVNLLAVLLAVMSPMADTSGFSQVIEPSLTYLLWVASGALAVGILTYPFIGDDRL